MAPRETENNAYAKFWGDKQRTLWYVMVFLEWSIKFGMAEARRLNWAILVEQQSQVKTQVVTYDYNTVRFNCTTVNI